MYPDHASGEYAAGLADRNIDRLAIDGLNRRFRNMRHGNNAYRRRRGKTHQSLA